MDKTNTNLHIYGTTFEHEARVFKSVDAMRKARLFDSAIMIGLRHNENLPAKESFGECAEIWRFKVKKGRSGLFAKIVSKLLFSWKVIRKTSSVRTSVITCHSLADLPLCCVLKFLKRAKLVYDAHELETETICSVGFRRILARVVERILIKYVDSTIVVSESIFHWYKKKYSLNSLCVVRNVPDKIKVDRSDVVDLKKVFAIPREHILFIYQGFIDEERGVDRLLRLFSQTRGDRHIVFLGFGDATEKVRRFSSEHSRIHLHDAVSSEDLLRHTAGADVGVHLIPNNCINHDYCLPNKFFQYIGMGLPVVVSDVKEMGSIVNHYNCGWILSSDDETKSVDFINGISQETVSNMKQGCINCNKAFTWEKERIVLVNVYKNLLL